MQGLTQGEARTISIETLGAAHGPVQDVRVVMDGEQANSHCCPSSIDQFASRRQSFLQR